MAKIPSETYKSDGYVATVYELARGLYYLVCKGKASKMEYVQRTNDLLKARLKEYPETDKVHFIIDTTFFEGLPPLEDVQWRIVSEARYLTGTSVGYVVMLLHQKGFILEASIDLLVHLANKIYPVNFVSVYSPEEALKLLMEKVTPDCLPWMYTTEEEVLKKVRLIISYEKAHPVDG
jgi:hypothetical protein